MTTVINGNSIDKGTGIWKWMAVTMTGIVISGGSFVLGYGKVDSRVRALELQVARVELKQENLGEQLDRMEDSLNKVVTFQVNAALTGNAK